MKFEDALELGRLQWSLKTGGSVSGALTLRDYFAAKAMQQLIPMVSDDPRTLMPLDFDVANMAYQMADAMLEARDGSQ